MWSLSLAKDIKNLVPDLKRAIEEVGYREALTIVDETLAAMDPEIPYGQYTGRLIDSGFGYINGKMVAETDQGRSISKYPIEPPENIKINRAKSGTYDIIISYHTPKPGTPGATVLRADGKFDYAPFVLEGRQHGEEMQRKESFRPRRVIYLKSVLKKSDFNPSKLRASITRGLEKGLGIVATRIKWRLSDLTKGP